MNSQIDELLIMPINAEKQIKDGGKMLVKHVHSKCIIIMM